MFDIGFTEMVLVGIVGLLVIGPERLPGAIRTGSHWLGRLKRGFNNIKREVQQELHNDEVMQELRRTGHAIKSQADNFETAIQSTTNDLTKVAADDNRPDDKAPVTDKRPE